MRKCSTATMGIDLGDRFSHVYAVSMQTGEVLGERRQAAALREVAGLRHRVLREAGALLQVLLLGVPLEVYVSKFSHMRFEPSGMTNDSDIRVAKSIVDYIFRWMGKKFLSSDQQEEAGMMDQRTGQ